MKSVAIFAALAGSAAAFAPANSGKSSTQLASVFDNYVGAVDFRGKEFKWDPVSQSIARIEYMKCTFIDSA